jgi:hypothetical protein
MTQSDAFRIALAQNIATNRRLIVALLAAANYTAGVHIAVAGAAVPVACAWLADIASANQRPALSAHFSRASIAVTVGLAIATFINCW